VQWQTCQHHLGDVTQNGGDDDGEADDDANSVSNLQAFFLEPRL
jgi:hypothetical protein